VPPPLMEKEQDAIEVEVVTIDGIAPVHESSTRQEKPPQPGGVPFDWQKWFNRIRKLDGRLWPLWVLLGAVALFLLLTVGAVAAVLFFIYLAIRNFLLGIVSAFRR
jgi:hypothetical protein